MLARLTILAALLLPAGTACAQEREWHLDTSESDAYLTFGVPESDDIGLSFWCMQHSGGISLFLPDAGEIKTGAPARLSIKAGAKTFSYRGKVQPNEESGGTSIQTDLAIDDPLFPALQKADRMSVTIAGEQQNFPLEGADVQGLIELCR